jgi:hypothetical protein
MYEPIAGAKQELTFSRLFPLTAESRLNAGSGGFFFGGNAYVVRDNGDVHTGDHRSETGQGFFA